MSLHPAAASERRPLSEAHVIWITAGLSCDGDTIAITAATQPSLEDLLMGAIPGIPRVILHNPVLAYEVGDDFLESMRKAARGELDPFILVVEGSIPDETLNTESFWRSPGSAGEAPEV